MKRVARVVSMLAVALAISSFSPAAQAMNKKEMAAKLAKKVDLSSTKAAEIVNIIFDASPRTGLIAARLRAGGEVAIPGFGTFGTKRAAVKTGTGYVPTFKAAPEFETRFSKATIVNRAASKPPRSFQTFVDAVAARAAITHDQALAVINAIFDARPGKGIIAIELDAGGKVTIPGFGTFGIQRRSGDNARLGREATPYPYFRPGKTLKERVAE